MICIDMYDCLICMSFGLLLFNLIVVVIVCGDAEIGSWRVSWPVLPYRPADIRSSSDRFKTAGVVSFLMRAWTRRDRRFAGGCVDGGV